MIPKFKVKLIQDVDLRYISYPSEKVVGLTDEEEDTQGCKGLCVNNFYLDLRDSYYWDNFLRCLKVEERLLEGADKSCRTREDFEKFINLHRDGFNPLFPEGAGDEDGDFEWGIASVSIAIASMSRDSAVVSSCRGHGGYKDKAHPYVAFWCKRDQARALRELAKGEPVGLVDQDLEGPVGLNLYSNNVMSLLEFSKKLYRERKRFKGL
jgi:hypothetical protein